MAKLCRTFPSGYQVSRTRTTQSSFVITRRSTKPASLALLLEGLEVQTEAQTVGVHFDNYRILLAEATLVTFSRIILGNVDECRTECEISDDTATTVAVVYETHEGWHVNVLRPLRDEELKTFNATVAAAKQSLSQYVNRMGSNPPEDTTVGTLSLWLMQKDDGARSDKPGNVEVAEA
jgi:hypothetical protein